MSAWNPAHTPAKPVQHWTRTKKRQFIATCGPGNATRPPLGFRASANKEGRSPTCITGKAQGPARGMGSRTQEESFRPHRPLRTHRRSHRIGRRAPQAQGQRSSIFPRADHPTYGGQQIFLYDPDGVGRRTELPRRRGPARDHLDRDQGRRAFGGTGASFGGGPETHEPDRLFARAKRYEAPRTRASP